jgi:GNAT superfamily N-acetyltransferase
MSYERYKNDYCISTDKSRLDIHIIHNFLKASYWAAGIPLETVEHSIAGSLCFGVYHASEQIGFARVISDLATFAYLADVFILEAYRGQGLSKWLLETMMSHPDLHGLRRWMLATRDAHELYRKFGFETVKSPDRWMEIHHPEIYSKK